jgi:hypothetical protein
MKILYRLLAVIFLLAASDYSHKATVLSWEWFAWAIVIGICLTVYGELYASDRRTR